MTHTTIDRCRVCEGRNLHPILDLGQQPLANRLRTKEQLAEPEPRYPLTVHVCEDCTLVQIAETVDPEILFGHYLYTSSTSTTMVDHARQMVDDIARARGLGPDSKIIEIASNDGYLLQHVIAKGIQALGIEPATNLAKLANDKGIPTHQAFFNEQVGTEHASQADVIIANNVLAHVADLQGFAAGIRHMLKPGGAAVFEVPHVAELVARTEFDTIYHEHLCYFSLHALQALFTRHGLTVTDGQRQAIHGGSIRVTVEEGGDPSAAALSILSDEAHLRTQAVYEAFATKTWELCARLKSELQRRKDAGERIAAYAAAAKGSTLLNTAGIGRELLEYIVDRSPLKQGLYAPGTGLEIRPPEVLSEDRPEAVLLLAWNLEGEVRRQLGASLEEVTLLTAQPALP